MVAAADLSTLAELGVVASVQRQIRRPVGPARELYEQRLGRARAGTMNPFGSMHRAEWCWPSAPTPVTPLAGWAMVRDARWHCRPEERLSTEIAFAAATVGGHRAGIDGAGVLVGAPASLAIWDLAGEPTDPRGCPRLRPVIRSRPASAP